MNTNTNTAANAATTPQNAPFCKVSPRNSKMGNIPSVSFLPTDAIIHKADGTPLTSIPGTCHNCEGCKGFCYIRDLIKFRSSMRASYERNTAALREDPETCARQIVAQIALYDRPFFRWHVSGDIDSPQHLSMIFNVCNATPATLHGIYTHDIGVYCDAIDAGATRPANLCVNRSMERRPTAEEVAHAIKYEYQFFIVDDRKSGLNDMDHCPCADAEGNKTGLTCDKCGRCYKLRPGAAIAEYLR